MLRDESFSLVFFSLIVEFEMLKATTALLLISLGTIGAIMVPNRVFAYTSKDPAVKEMIAGGLSGIARGSREPTRYGLSAVFEGGMGERVIGAYAHMKLKHDPNDPVVVNGVKSAQTVARRINERDPGGHHSYTNYVAAVSVLLLAEVDRLKYRKDLEKLAAYFSSAQMPNGGYSYKGEPLGDVSQTQYAILALWTLDKAGLVINYEGVVKTIKWLLRVQDPSGGWPYHAIDPGASGKRVKQSRVNASITLAGGSSLLIAGDILQLWGDDGNSSDFRQAGIPEAVWIFKDGMENAGYKRPRVPTEPILDAIKECEAYLGKNTPDPGKEPYVWAYYQLYTLERYKSFLDVALKRKPKEVTDWYDYGVEFLKKSETAAGGWPAANPHISAGVTNAFALLFLSRSTQKAIEQSQEGVLAGGFGLPDDTTKIRVDGTQIKGEPVAEAVTDLLDMLEGEDPNALEGKSLPEDMKLATEPKARKAQVDRLIRLVRGSSSWQARRVAARLLGQSDEMRVVPALIFALDDPDTVVRTYARDGLRFISRKFEGFGMEIQPGEKQDYGELRRAQRLWKQWYLTMDPGYIFMTE